MVRKIFGTDGIRGKVNSEFINAEFAQKLGIACGKYFLSKSGDERSNRVIIGKDTRRSGYMLETALTSGFTSIGMDVFLLGPIPTPAVGMLTRSMRADLGVMISASHNNFEDNGIKFIGPPYTAIKIMGDKIISKKHAKNSGISTIPGVQDEIKSIEEAVKASKKVGFPLMIKASAGGGGKGMRIVYKEKELNDKFISAKNEAKTSFGDSRVFIEKFIEDPHHIEIQIVGDQFGNYLHLGCLLYTSDAADE